MSRWSTATTVEPPEVEQLVANGAVIIDVRESFEWRSGHIDGAMHVPLLKLQPHDFIAHHALVTVCRTGHRSAIAARRLRTAGLDARSLAGGMNAWRKAGFATSKGDTK